MRSLQNILLISANILLLIILILLVQFVRLQKIAPFGGSNMQSSKDTSEQPNENPITYYINPSGNDTNAGTSENNAWKTIQKGLDVAKAGDTIVLAEGMYKQDVVTKRDGSANAPITIKGNAEAIVKGAGNARVFEINHSYIALQGFTVDGLTGGAKDEKAYRDKLIYVQGKERKKAITGIKVLNMTIKNGGGECIRFRYFAQKNEIAYNTIVNCGVHDFVFDGGGKNGEGIYIGTAPEQLTDGKNPTRDPDASNENWVHHNNINTQANECVDIKEGASENIVENNICTGQKDPESAGMDARGNTNTFRSNEIYDNIGAGVRLGGDSKKDGINNNIYNNVIKNNKAGGIKLQRIPQGKICGNIMQSNAAGNAGGSFGSKISPTKPC